MNRSTFGGEDAENIDITVEDKAEKITNCRQEGLKDDIQRDKYSKLQWGEPTVEVSKA